MSLYELQSKYANNGNLSLFRRRRTLALNALEDIDVYPPAYVDFFIEGYILSFARDGVNRVQKAHDHAIRCYDRESPEIIELRYQSEQVGKDARPAWLEECSRRRFLFLRWCLNRYGGRSDTWHYACAQEWDELVSAHFAGDCPHCGVALREDTLIYPEPVYVNEHGLKPFNPPVWESDGGFPLLIASVCQQCCVACLSSSGWYQDFRHARAMNFLWHGLASGFPQLSHEDEDEDVLEETLEEKKARVNPAVMSSFRRVFRGL